VTGGTPSTVENGLMYNQGALWTGIITDSTRVATFSPGEIVLSTSTCGQSISDQNVTINNAGLNLVGSLKDGLQDPASINVIQEIKTNRDSFVSCNSFPRITGLAQCDDVRGFTSGYDVTDGSSLTNVGNIAGYYAATTLGNQSTFRNNAAHSSYGFYSNIPTANNLRRNYNFYAAGTAPNFFKGIIETESALRVYPDGVAGSDISTDANNASGLTQGTYLTVKRVSTGNSSVCALFIKKNTAGSNPSSTVQRVVTFRATDGTNRIESTIRTDGSGGFELANISDYRAKENIVDLPSAVDQVKAFRPVNYNYIWSPGKTRPGFIAHELAETLPVAAIGTKDETEAIGTLLDWDGTELETDVVEPSAEELTYTEDITDSEGVTTQAVRNRTWTATGTQPIYQGVDQTKLIPLLVKSLQEALERIEVLEAAAGGGTKVTTRKKR
jgi:hypothetical protein